MKIYVVFGVPPDPSGPSWVIGATTNEEKSLDLLKKTEYGLIRIYNSETGCQEKEKE